MILGVLVNNIVVNIRNQLSENRLTKKIRIFAHCRFIFWSIQNYKKSNGGGLKNYPLLITFYRTIVINYLKLSQDVINVRNPFTVITY
jgi:hypothetical protein